VSAVRGSWRAHAVCAGILALEGLAALAGHRGTQSLEESARSGPAAQRIDALHVLLERGEPDPSRYGELLAADLLADGDPLAREFAFTTAVCKNTGPGKQYRYLRDRQEAGEITPHFWRTFVLLRRKIGVVVGGSSGRLRLRELDWWLDAVAERPLPAQEVLDHIRENP
jgi:hypothetical protein